MGPAVATAASKGRISRREETSTLQTGTFGADGIGAGPNHPGGINPVQDLAAGAGVTSGSAVAGALE